MADLSTAFSRAGPVAACMIAFFPGKVGRAVILGSRQNVMPVRLVATAVHLIAIFVQSRSFDDVRADVQLIKIDGDQLAFGVVPGAGSDPVASGNASPFLNLGAEIGAPGAPCGVSGKRCNDANGRIWPIIPTVADNDPFDGGKSVHSARRVAPGDLGDRTSGATTPMGRFPPPSC